MVTYPLVSILMTVYNREKFLEDAILSVLESWFNDFELIIVDDCSTDDSKSIALRYASMDSRIKFFTNEVNLGDYPNRNKAAEYAKGKYIKYLDADDIIYPWGLSVIVSCMEKNPDAGFGLCSIHSDKMIPFPIFLTPGEAYYRHYFKAAFFDKAPSSCIIRRDVFIKYGGFSGRRYIGDFEFWQKLCRFENVLLMPIGMIFARSHPGQESAYYGIDSLILFDCLVLDVNAMSQPDCPLDKKDRDEVLFRTRYLQSRSVLRSIFYERSFKKTTTKLKLAGFSLPKAILIFINWKLRNFKSDVWYFRNF